MTSTTSADSSYCIPKRFHYLTLLLLLLLMLDAYDSGEPHQSLVFASDLIVSPQTLESVTCDTVSTADDTERKYVDPIGETSDAPVTGRKRACKTFKKLI
ncbi:hypothetical protein RIF29_28973 [Crotalaria pallida]|uniref:Uncharacterized protein n=1 Tax=Crotalaria pallida TaxID=3830 RepID=A0AAN9EFU7_CROPI